VNEYIDKLACQWRCAHAVDTVSLGEGGLLKKRYSSGDGLHLRYRGNKALAELILEAMVGAD
jgi:hypothetical protein